MKKFILILLTFTMMLYADTEYADPKPDWEHPRLIVFAVTEDSPHAYDHVLSVTNNVIKFYGASKVLVKIVAYSQGINLLVKSNSDVINKRVKALMQYDVEFIACHNTMKTLHIKESDLIEGTETVTAGVVELLESVKKGWVYIKP